MKLVAYVKTLDFMSARKSSEYVGTKLDNPAMILEESVTQWSHTTSLEEVLDALDTWQDRVCIQGFPARYSPQFWLAHAALSAIYKVLCAILHSNQDEETVTTISGSLMQLWVHLISAGPGSSHLEMMDIILKNPLAPLWGHIQTLKGDNLKLLLSTLKTNFVYVEEVPADHYATLMETHIDKIFKTILSVAQFEDGQRDMVDLQLFYLSHMNHVPPHIGPRLSHLCFLICNRYKLENPYMGLDDWVVTRHHLRLIKEVIIHPSFTRASEAQYRAPITLEKIFQAAVLDGMLQTVYKDFMSLLTTICNYSNSRKCQRLFSVYQTGLFEQIDWKKGFEKCPYWLFDETIKTMIVVAGSNSMEAHMEDFLISTQNLCLMTFVQLSASRVQSWLDLMVSYVVSGRRALTAEAASLLISTHLEKCGVLDWKKHLNEAKMFVDIVADVPKAFLQNDDECPLSATLHAYVTFLERLFDQMKCLDLGGEIRENVERCLVRCLTKDPVTKATIVEVCLKSELISFHDSNFIREVLFSVDKLLKDIECTQDDGTLYRALSTLLAAFLHYFKEKGFIATDFNSLLTSICVTCIVYGGYSHTTVPHDTLTGHMTEPHGTPHDIWEHLYHETVLMFIDLHLEKGTFRSLGALVFDTLLAVKDTLQRGEGTGMLVPFLHKLETSCKKLLEEHGATIVELYLDWECFFLKDLVEALYHQEHGPLIARFLDIYNYVWETPTEQRHHVIFLLVLLAADQPQLFSGQHVGQLLDTYNQEMEVSRSYILQIMSSLAERSRSLIRGYYSRLTDDTIFTPESLTSRAEIVVKISQECEDLQKKTIDYLMKHIDSKTPDVSTATMAALVPLIKGSPLVQKNKQRFRNLHKSSSADRVKELCAQLLPELRTQTGIKQPIQRKPIEAQKETKKIPFLTKPKGLAKSGQPSVKQLAKIQDTSQSKKASLVEREESKTIIVQVLENSKEEGHQACGDTNKVEKVERAIQQSKIAIATGVNTENKQLLNRSHQDIQQHDVLSAENQISEKHNHRDSISHGEIIATPFESSNFGGVVLDSKLDSQKEVCEKTESQHSCQSERTTLGPIIAMTKQKPNDEITLLKMQEEQTKHIQKNCAEKETDYPTSHVDMPIVILATVGESKPVKLQQSLKDSGFHSTLRPLTAELGVILQDFKLVAVCLTDSLVISPEVMMNINAIKSSSTPALFIMFSKEHKLGNDLLIVNSLTCIRFFMMPGEKPYKNMSWPLNAYKELMMFINYYGIFPEDRSKTEEPSLMLQAAPAQNIFDDGSQNLHLYASPNVFISYKWGDQDEVQPLYTHLTQIGFCCWFGAFQISGNESLYNKISQGLQGCRVVIACMTSGYTQTANCQQEVTIAQNLGRPIIPLLLGNKLRWPPPGEMGSKFAKYGYFRVGVGLSGLDVEDPVMDKLVQSLDKFIPNVVSNQNVIHCEKNSEDESYVQNVNKRTHESELANSLESNFKQNQIEDSAETTMNTSRPVAAVMNNNHTDKSVSQGITANIALADPSKSGFKLPKSSSMFELEATPQKVSGVTKQHNKTDDDLYVKERSVGYSLNANQVRSSRSKSCLIL